MLKRLYRLIQATASHKKAHYFLSTIAFLESFIFPIAPDVLLIPMSVSVRKKAFYYAFLCTAWSALGSIVGYLIGLFLFKTIGRSILDMYHIQAQFQTFASQYDKMGVIILLIGALTPVPYKLITIASGALHMNFLLFFLAGTLARGARFYLVALLSRNATKVLGGKTGAYIERHQAWFMGGLVVLIVLGFIFVKYILK